MALAIHRASSLATSTRHGMRSPLIGISAASRRSVAGNNLQLTKRAPTALNAYHPAGQRHSGKKPTGRSKNAADEDQHMTLTPYPPRNSREVAEGVWAYIMLGGLLFTGMLFVLPEFSMAIPMIMKAVWGQS